MGLLYENMPNETVYTNIDFVLSTVYFMRMISKNQICVLAYHRNCYI